MSISNPDKAVLLSLTYAAQFSHPMKNGVRRVFDTLISPKLPFQSPATYLDQILHLLKLNDSFEEIVPTTVGHNDHEIRDFLEVLAAEIESRYPNYRRSGGTASTSGKWSQYDSLNNTLILEKGELLPDAGGNAVIWVYVEPMSKRLPEELIKNEFQNFYTREIAAGAPKHKDPEKYAEASAKRLMEYFQEGDEVVAADILVELAGNSGHSLLKEIDASTGMQWTSNSENFEWLSKVLRGIAERVRSNKV
ncbi:hypothetical protein [Noviherbaspirillum sp. Root189]|uniref:hypothetical protein n=1 Tax=Noviherbaspirillum sp. Root189 TaxID=1736487 RepID=UPI00070EAF83|nr:hypothetical protein [Noviherbaspirillum sp. Root189]KRB77628.1 hypothetical protein ASE07_26130 [Noviherbaspirillum sp. Root189]